MTKASEIKYVLTFFAQSQSEQWRQVPDTLPPVWVRVGRVETATDKPILVLALILYDQLNGWPFEDKALTVLDEIRSLLFWMIESPRTYIFAKRAQARTEEELLSSADDCIWLVLRRLCLIALSYDSLKQCPAEGLTFEYFREKYTYLIDPEGLEKSRIPIL